ncbi:MAG: ECF transporter S component [Actinomycetota bacterium]
MQLSVQKIVLSGLLGAIAIFLALTRLGFIPVPNLSGNATIMHVPVILGAVLAGPLVGAIVGLIFGVFSFLQATVPLFADPLVSIPPRIVIGITAYYAYAAFRSRNQVLALGAAAVVGTLTNTVLVLGVAVLRKYLPLEAVVPIIPQAVAEIVIATILVVAIGKAAARMNLAGSGETTAATKAGVKTR